MPNFAGTWKMKSSENFDELLKALGVNAMLRKVAVAAASKPHVEIRQDGDQFYIKTSTTVRTTEINFKVGESFEEETVDGRKCRSLATWENENKIYCKQTLIEGEGPKTYWTRELANDELILTFGADDVVCTRIYQKQTKKDKPINRTGNDVGFKLIHTGQAKREKEQLSQRCDIAMNWFNIIYVFKFWKSGRGMYTSMALPPVADMILEKERTYEYYGSCP
ncbi:C5a anaphylatoxin chemotactic receptor 1-like [Platysternon megacephalum]|uniref:C5a anaphylatoxin chemotactic receptor 1-like n=1 Tax=Platysternon megacephalum TaxID=55544 RepID=A0A4D9DS89_9SAUR|nr:C5a anaphylatoxin chemotactic receptor 1-like [Platysternon megacephalum]